MGEPSEPSDGVSGGPPGGSFHLPVLGIIGVGMIGGSLALALKAQNRVGKVIGAGRSRASLQRALRLGVIDEIADDPAGAAAAAGVIVLAAPVNAIAGLFEAIAPALNAGAGRDKILTDVGSVKTGICEAAEAVLGAHIGRFVPGHPVAGKEHSGVGAASADLFRAHNVVLTPTASTDADALELVERMWRAAGARVRIMEAARHDRILAVTSHLPHVLAYAMVEFFAAAEDPDACCDMAAGGFYDFTRTASSEPEMWRDICLMNRAQILRQLDGFSARLAGIARLLEHADGEALERLFADSARTRAMVADKRAQPPRKPQA